MDGACVDVVQAPEGASASGSTSKEVNVYAMVMAHLLGGRYDTPEGRSAASKHAGVCLTQPRISFSQTCSGQDYVIDVQAPAVLWSLLGSNFDSGLPHLEATSPSKVQRRMPQPQPPLYPLAPILHRCRPAVHALAQTLVFRDVVR